MGFALGGRRILFRLGKETPTKLGHFVTLWQRRYAITDPFDRTDDYQFVFVVARTKTNAGFFLFPQDNLVQKNTFSQNYIGGKRTIRIYSPWISTRDQQWQKNYFNDFSDITKCVE